MRWRLALMGLLLTWALPAWADPTGKSTIRFGQHPGFGRIVLDVEHGEALVVGKQGDTLVVATPGSALTAVGHLPRNVVGLTYGAVDLSIAIAPGATFRRMVVNHHLVLDILDPSLSKPDSVKAVPIPVPIKLPPKLIAPPAPPAPIAVPVAAQEAPAAPPVILAAPEPAPPTTPQDPAALAATLRAVPQAGPGHRLAIPFAPQVGAAAFRRGAEGVVVFDERKPVDLANVASDPVFGHASVQLLPNATLLRVPLPPGTELRLERQKDGWTLTAIGGNAMPGALQPITPETFPDHILLPAQQPGLIVSVPDTLTGATLLVGTQRSAGQGVQVARQAPDFVVLPSWQGIAVAPLSDALVLHARAEGFEIAVAGSGVSLAAAPPDPSLSGIEAASRMTHSFDLPPLRTLSLIRRLQGAIQSAAEAPAQSKAQARSAVAEAMLALGMGAEAQAVLALATSDDARQADNPQSRALAALASLLAGRPEEAGFVDDPALDGSDEINLWRAVRQAMLADASGGATPASAVEMLANTLPLLGEYPAELRSHILPLVGETLAEPTDNATQLAAAQSLLDRFKDDPNLDLARAMLAEARGEADEALARYDTLSTSPDRRVRLRAVRRATELRLATGRMNAAEAASKLGKMFFAWRGDGREIELRERVAALLAQSSQWRPALQLLREAKQDWPDHAAELGEQLRSVFAAAIRPDGQASLKPFDMVALAEENADLMPDGEAGLALAQVVCDQLLALDLPERGIALLDKMIATAPRGAARAALGERLAGLKLAQSDPSGAISALSRTAADSLPAALLESRGIDFAAAVASQGDFPSARHALLELDSEAADRKLVELAEAAHLWADAQIGWQRLANRVLPPSGLLSDDQSELVLRLASAAAAAKDEPALAQLHRDIAPRLKPGKTADLFNLITTQKLRGTDDLGAVAHDVALAKSAQL